jgi:hypothetical protein
MAQKSERTFSEEEKKGFQEAFTIFVRNFNLNLESKRIVLE